MGRKADERAVNQLVTAIWSRAIRASPRVAATAKSFVVRRSAHGSDTALASASASQASARRFVVAGGSVEHPVEALDRYHARPLFVAFGVLADGDSPGVFERIVPSQRVA